MNQIIPASAIHFHLTKKRYASPQYNYNTYKTKIIVEPGYNDIGLCDISSITSDILWYANQFLAANRNIILLG